MLSIDALKDIRPFIATPSYSGAMTSDYVRSLLGLVNLAWRHGFPMQTRFLDGDSLIPRARNRLVAEFMADSRWTHLFWIDADIGFEPEAALRLLLAGRAVVAGAYPHKNDGWPRAGLAQPLPAGSTREDFEARHAVFPVNLTGPEVAGRVDADGFVEVLDAPTGFMLIERAVFERLAQALPELRYTPDRMEDEAAAAWPHHRFFDVWAEPGNGRYLSEDFAFCRRWQSIGGQVFVDTRSRLTHTGTRVYRGDYARSLAASAGPSA
ncbi:hypothetical protein APR50_12980 [Variovorax paradoxus]|jgi:hypothetical protein|uniref:hypothetical protein n=1 Tax=Variovorax paradoxus TaxID=34073 RepID=UPI0006E51E25|nr:hypothetical protein APR52_26325 [Variovorax paradoxus]KPV07809.1 hypothetical protein APR50_12980 [Variovorax paradoxus]KPV09667.1 hypothetical protein APR49_12545 [Variovorax paradoxus]KPV20091.1 hypothetical protein APR51_18150 [Variovorax paradoxus]KPV30481.1 hypothetical protein APR48_19605 [Variovorax paradoxus]